MFICVRIQVLAAAIAIFSCACSALPQGRERVEFAQSFEVGSIKPNTASNARISITGQPGGRFVATNVTLKMLLRNGYSLPDSQLIGGPGWITTDRFDVEARSPAAARPPDRSQMMAMLRSLLEDRFQLKLHRETRDLPVYNLVVGKNRVKMKLSANQTPPATKPPYNDAPTPGSLVSRGPGNILVTGLPMSRFVNFLSQQLGRPTIDKTNLRELFDFTLQWTPLPGQGLGLPPDAEAESSETDGPSIFTAIQEQLGLRLESAKGPVEVIVIDGASRPSGN